MDKLHTPEVDRLFRAILTLETMEDCYNFFEDACTVKEIIDISQEVFSCCVFPGDPAPERRKLCGGQQDHRYEYCHYQPSK